MLKDRVRKAIPPRFLPLARRIYGRVYLPVKRVRAATRAFRQPEIVGRLAIKNFGPFTVAFRKGTADEGVIGHSFGNDIFMGVVPEYRPKETDVIIDVGAHIGTFSLLLAASVPRGQVYAIEASAETFDYLTLNVALNKTTNITVSHLALMDKEGQVVLHHDVDGNWGHSAMKRLSGHGEVVPSESLAGYFARHGIATCQLMKFNCEGAEFPILMSAPLDLLRKIDRMIVLYHLDLAEGSSLPTLLDRLKSAGLRTKIVNQEKYRGWVIADRAH